MSCMKKFVVICISLFLLAACKKKVDELPPATQTGANTFGAKVNGELWVPQVFGPLANDILETRLFANGDLSIKASNFSLSPTETEFDIFIKGVTATGTYLLNSNATYPSMLTGYGYYVKRVLTPKDEWITSSTATGSVTITRIDPLNKIVSGTFQFNAASIYTPSQILMVTDGRFDLKIQ